MNFKILGIVIKKRLFDILLIGFLLLLIFSPDTKTWFLRQFISTGLFRVEIKKAHLDNSTAKVFFFFKDSTGKTVSTEDLKGKIVLINFWASWCPPCRAEMPSLETLYNKLRNDSRLAFVFINEDEDLSKARYFLEKNMYTMPFYTSSGIVPTVIFNGSLPTTIVLDKEGNIVLKHEGMARYDTDSFLKQLKELL